MILVNELIWDDWNREHIARHGITPREVEEIFKGKYTFVESYRKRILAIGKTKTGRGLAVVLSKEDRTLKPYGLGIYYPITAFLKEVKQ